MPNFACRRNWRLARCEQAVTWPSGFFNQSLPFPCFVSKKLQDAACSRVSVRRLRLLLLN